MLDFGLLAAEIVSLVLVTQANFNGFRVLAALLHGSVLVGVSQTLRRWTESATYIRQGGHHVGHWPTFYSWCMKYIRNLSQPVSITLYKSCAMYTQNVRHFWRCGGQDGPRIVCWGATVLLADIRRRTWKSALGNQVGS